MSSHRRPGVLARALRLRRPPKGAIPVPRRAGVEVVDARTRVAHQVSPRSCGLVGHGGITRRCVVPGCWQRA